MELYHADIKLPTGFTLPNRVIDLKYTRHAVKASNNDRYGYIPILSTLDLGQCRTVEVGTLNGKVAKVVVRTHLDTNRDIVLVLIPHQPTAHTWTVKTVWVNVTSDTHRTLDRSRYVG